MKENTISQIITHLTSFLNEKKLIQISLSDYTGTENQLVKCVIKPIIIKKKLQLSFVYKYKTKDITKNLNTTDGFEMISEWLDRKEFKAINIQTSVDIQTYQYQKDKWMLTSEKKTDTVLTPNLQHDHLKDRAIQSDNKYLQLLSVSNAQGKIYQHAQDKYKQINQYINLISPAIKSLDRKSIHVVDMGSGKGYLTFALYDYMKQQLGKDTSVIGVEYREDLVQFCNDTAAECGFKGLSFVQGSIQDYHPIIKPNITIALHACDTATDDAISQGILNESDIIVTAPCCHKQIRRTMEKNKTNNVLTLMNRYGIFLERNAEMITDGIRALILEYFGYHVKVMEFISDAHTPKNVMILAVKRKIDPDRQESIRTELNEIKETYGIDHHHLEKLMFD